MERTRRRLSVYLQSVIPAFLLGRAVYRISRSRRRWLKDILIRGFVRLYGVDAAEAGAPVPEGYDSFNAFFTRSLKPGARPHTDDPLAVASPVDGTIQQCGFIRGETLLQVKGITYTLSELLNDAPASARFRDGAFAAIYLAPHDYHRVHMPCAGVLKRMVYLPGARWSVNATTVAAIAGLFARNERLVFHFEAASGPFAIVMVGALNVGSISTAWSGEVLPAASRTVTAWEFASADKAVRLGAGEYLAHFNLGSTVIVVFPRGMAGWRNGLREGVVVRVGEALGTLGGRPEGAA